MYTAREYSESVYYFIKGVKTVQKNNTTKPFILKKAGYPAHSKSVSRKKRVPFIEDDEWDLDENADDDSFIDLDDLGLDVEVEDTNFIGSKVTKSPQNRSTLKENEAFVGLLGRNILLSLQADQLNILGQTFRPVFSGKLILVTDGYIQLDPVIIKFPNAPFHRHPTPLNFPINRIIFFVPFDPNTRFPIQ